MEKITLFKLRNLVKSFNLKAKIPRYNSMTAEELVEKLHEYVVVIGHLDLSNHYNVELKQDDSTQLDDSKSNIIKSKSSTVPPSDEFTRDDLFMMDMMKIHFFENTKNKAPQYNDKFGSLWEKCVSSCDGPPCHYPYKDLNFYVRKD